MVVHVGIAVVREAVTVERRKRGALCSCGERRPGSALSFFLTTAQSVDANMPTFPSPRYNEDDMSTQHALQF